MLEGWICLILVVLSDVCKFIGKILFGIGQAEERFLLVILYLSTEIWETLRGFCQEEKYAH